MNAMYAYVMQDFYTWVAILSLLLAFAFFMFFRPQAVEFFTGSQMVKKQETGSAVQEADATAEGKEEEAK